MSAGVLTPDRLTGVWTAVPEACRAGFRVRDKLVGVVAGTIPVRSGVVQVGAAGDVRSARLELDVTGIATGNAHRDRDLRKPRFLAAGEHPILVVEAGPAPFGAAGNWDLTATVTVRGAAAPVDLMVVLDSADPATAGVRVTGRLDRTPLGLRVPAFIVGRIVELDVHLAFRR